MKYFVRNVMLLVALCISFASIATASPILYTVSGVGSGTLGVNSFTNSLVTISATGDTSLAPSSGSFQAYTLSPVNLTVAGVGSTTFSISVDLFVNQGLAFVGFRDSVGTSSILDSGNPVFSAYNLNQALAPTVGSQFIRPDLSFATGLGNLNIQSMGDVTYSAVVSDGAVPEPSTGMTLLVGCIGIACVTRRKKVSAQMS